MNVKKWSMSGLCAVLLVALGWNAAFRVSAAAMTPRAMLPLIVTQAQPVTPQVYTLVDHDTSFIAASYHQASGRIFVSYIDRQNGNRLHITEDIGTSLVEVDLPPEIIAALELEGTPGSTPAAVFPGEKQAAATQMIIGDVFYLWVSSRDVGSPTGEFKLKKVIMPIPKRKSSL